nr:hypothetical protein [Tanacetum cinerariifolium]
MSLDISTKGFPDTTCDNLGSMIELISSIIIRSATFDGHPSVMMGFLRNKDGIRLYIGTKLDDSRNELSLRTFFVMNEIDGSGGEGFVLLLWTYGDGIDRTVDMG